MSWQELPYKHRSPEVLSPQDVGKLAKMGEEFEKSILAPVLNTTENDARLREDLEHFIASRRRMAPKDEVASHLEKIMEGGEDGGFRISAIVSRFFMMDADERTWFMNYLQMKDKEERVGGNNKNIYHTLVGRIGAALVYDSLTGELHVKE